MKAANWTPEEDAALRAIYTSDFPVNRRRHLIEEHFAHRSIASAHHRAARLGLVRTVRPARRWTDEEVATLKRDWGTVPLVELAKTLDRNPGSLSLFARRIGLPLRQSWVNVVSTPQIDNAIRDAYASPQRGPCVRVAKKFKLDHHWVCYRARALGLSRRSRVDVWTPEENEILERTHEKGGVKHIQSRLKAAGYTRSLSAIENQMTRLDLSSTARDVYTASDIARVMGVDSKQVARWIDKGMLRARRENRTGLQDYEVAKCWLIEHRHVRQFLIDHVAQYYVGRIDKFWLVSTLAGHSATLHIQQSAGTRSEAASGFEEATCTL